MKTTNTDVPFLSLIEQFKTLVAKSSPRFNSNLPLRRSMRGLSLLLFITLAPSSSFGQLNLLTEEVRYIDATRRHSLGRRVDIGTDFVVTQTTNGPLFGFDELPLHPLLIWEIGGSGQPIKILNNEQPGQFANIGSPFQNFSVSQSEIVASISSSSPHLYQQDEGGADNWGLVKIIGSENAGNARISGDTIAALGSFLALSFYERDEGGADNWGLSKQQTLNDSALSPDLDGDVFAYAVNIDSSELFEIRIRQRNAGGSNNWGLVKTISYPGMSSIANFGESLSVSGDTLIVGAPSVGEGSGFNGEVFVFQQDAGGADNWGLVTQLTPTASFPASVPNDRSGYGTAVDIDGDSVIVGSPGSGFDVGTFAPGVHAGRYFHFSRNQGGADQWGQTGSFSSNADQGHARGRSVGIKGSNFVVGIPLSSEVANTVDTDLEKTGAIGIGTVPSGSEAFRTHLSLVTETGTNAAAQIAVNQSHLVFSSQLKAPIEGPAVTTFERQFGISSTASGDAIEGVQQVGKIPTLTRRKSFSNFGSDLAVNDTGWLVVGDRVAREDAGAPFKGEAYLYRLTGRRWLFEKTLEPNEVIFGDQFFGQAVALQEELLAVGASLEASPAAGAGGAVYIYGLNQGGSENWGEIARIRLPAPQNGDDFGRALSLDGQTLAVGIPGDDDDRGAVAIFEQDEGGAHNWGLSQLIVAPTRQAGEEFGISIALFEDRLVVGGKAEQAYLFERNEGGVNQWGHTQTLTDQDGFNSGAEYGAKVAIGKDRIAVGARNKTTNANGKGVVRIYEHEAITGNFSEVSDLVASDGATINGFMTGDLLMYKDEVFVGSAGGEFMDRFRGKTYVFNLPPTVIEVGLNQSTETNITAARDHKLFQTEGAVKSINVRFSQDVISGSDQPDTPEFNAFNPDNYILVDAGEDDAMQSASCVNGVQGDDTEISFENVVYSPDAQTTTLSLAQPDHLNTGEYRLIICGTTSITSYWNNKLDGDFDGDPGDDYVLDFKLTAAGFCVPIKTRNASIALICL